MGVMYIVPMWLTTITIVILIFLFIAIERLFVCFKGTCTEGPAINAGHVYHYQLIISILQVSSSQKTIVL